MTLRNLYKIGQLSTHETELRQIRKMLMAAARNITDAATETISSESRLGLAYAAIIQLSMIALWTKGYRPSKSAPGHHQTMIQSLVHSIDLGHDKILLLDTFRVRRNAMDYEGVDVDSTVSVACLDAARELFDHVSRKINCSNRIIKSN